jgi:hypothetical protein
MITGRATLLQSTVRVDAVRVEPMSGFLGVGTPPDMPSWVGCACVRMSSITGQKQVEVSSWRVLGGYILMIYSAFLGLSFLAAMFGATGWRHFLLWPSGLFAIRAAIYTGFLFAQAKGRDLWLSPALPVQLGHVAPLLLLELIPGAPLGMSLTAGICSLIGLLVFEHIWVIAGQSVPLS